MQRSDWSEQEFRRGVEVLETFLAEVKAGGFINASGALSHIISEAEIAGRESK